MAGADVTAVRQAVGHPIVDADGHVVESIPVVVDYLRRQAGRELADRFPASSATYASRQAPLLRPMGSEPNPPGRAIPPWWTLPATARDRATAFLPRLLRERLDDIGIDFAVLYSSVGLTCLGHPDEGLRRASCRAVNTYLADALDGCADRLTAAAVVPTHTPDEALAELDHAVNQLGFKAVMLNSFVTRPVPGDGSWVDVLALDSPYDYDPVWARCVELGVAVTVHSPTMNLALRQSTSRYMYNHIGNFAAGADAFAKALFFGGVGHRFPRLNVGFLECGVAWGVQLLCDLVSRWEKRGGANIERLDPTRVDGPEWERLLVRYGGEPFADAVVRAAARGQSDNPPGDRDDFRSTGVCGPGDIVGQFDRWFFGCEADDPTVAWAFAETVNPLGARLRPMLGSDIGHWDVSDIDHVVPEAYELVERGLVTAEQFRAFACDHAIRLHGEMNPAFFDGTAVAAYARTVLAPSRQEERG